MYGQGSPVRGLGPREELKVPSAATWPRGAFSFVAQVTGSSTTRLQPQQQRRILRRPGFAFWQVTRSIYAISGLVYALDGRHLALRRHLLAGRVDSRCSGADFELHFGGILVVSSLWISP